MNPFYLVSGTLIRTKDSTENPIVIHQICKNQDLLEARKRAFEIFDNYVDVMKLSVHDSQTEHTSMSDFFENPKTDSLAGKILSESFEKNFENGICIYLVLNDEAYTTIEGEVVYANKLLIHSFDDGAIDISEYIENGIQQEQLLLQKNSIFIKK